MKLSGPLLKTLLSLSYIDEREMKRKLFKIIIILGYQPLGAGDGPPPSEANRLYNPWREGPYEPGYARRKSYTVGKRVAIVDEEIIPMLEDGRDYGEQHYHDTQGCEGPIMPTSGRNLVRRKHSYLVDV